MQIRSDIPYGSVCIVGRPIRFEGYADDFAHGISAVQFSLDDGEHWTTYSTAGAVSEKGVSWQFSYTPSVSGSYTLKARAVNGEGVAAEVSTRFSFVAVESVSSSAVESAFASRQDLLERACCAAEYGALEQTSPCSGGDIRLRAVGGGSLEGARLFRSAELTGISAGQIAYITETLGVRSVYDLRSRWEVALHPEPCLAGAKSVAFEPSEERRRKNASSRLVAGIIGEYGAPEERMRLNYRRYVKDYPLIGAALRAIATEVEPALVHCVNGKDRTGVLCAVLLRAAGWHSDDIMADYLAANEVNGPHIEREFAELSVGMTRLEKDILRSFLEARPTYLEAFFDEAAHVYGSFERYIVDGLRLTPAHVERLSLLAAR